MFENSIKKQLNADEQEITGSAPAEEGSTAITTAPVADSATSGNADSATGGEEGSAENAGTNSKQEREPETAHDDFDWSVDKRNVTSYTSEEKDKYHKVYENTFVQLNDGQMMNGTVVGVTKTDVVLNIGFKSDGLISLNEYRARF